MGTPMEHLATPAPNPPAAPVTRGPAACPHPYPCQASTRKLWFKWQNKNIHINNSVSVTEREGPQMATLEPGDERLHLLQEGENRTAPRPWEPPSLGAPFPGSPPSLGAPCPWEPPVP